MKIEHKNIDPRSVPPFPITTSREVNNLNIIRYDKMSKLYNFIYLLIDYIPIFNSINTSYFKDLNGK